VDQTHSHITNAELDLFLDWVVLSNRQPPARGTGMLEDVNEQLTKRFINLPLQIWRHCRHVFTRPDFCTNVLYDGRPVKPFLVK
jgi:hypothetical protein